VFSGRKEGKIFSEGELIGVSGGELRHPIRFLCRSALVVARNGNISNVGVSEYRQLSRKPEKD
jgi:hypothetical protein